LSSEIEQLKKENKSLKDRLKKIEEDYKNLKDEYEEFKAKHACTVEELKKAMHLKPNLYASKKSLGAKKGHKAYTRKIPEKIDNIHELNQNHCNLCNSKLPEKSQEVRARYVTDLHFTAKLETTKYNIHRKYCKKCKKLVEPKVPNALPNARFGLNLMLFIMYLRIGMRIPVNKIQEFMQTLFDLHISEGEIVSINGQLAKAFGHYYKHLEKLLKIAKVKHSDTTSWRTMKKNYTAWIFVTVGVVLYKITRRGKADIPLKLFGKNQNGNVLVADRHSVNRSLIERLGFTMQSCWSHILGDSKDFAKNFGIEGKYIHRKLKQIFADAKSLDHSGTKEQTEKLEERVIALNERHYKHSTVRKWVKNLVVRDIKTLFIFVSRPDVEPTNNISERGLRKLVVHRKISNCSRSVAGADSLAVLYSVMETVKQGNNSLFDSLKQIIASEK
jgi:hypothetical protein